MSLKNPMTQPVIDPGTVRLVAQCLNHYATPGPIFFAKLKKIPLIMCFVTIKVNHFFHYLVDAINKVNIPLLTTV
jgi:hypothetical protein